MQFNICVNEQFSSDMCNRPFLFVADDMFHSLHVRLYKWSSYNINYLYQVIDSLDSKEIMLTVLTQLPEVQTLDKDQFQVCLFAYCLTVYMVYLSVYISRA